VEINKVYLEGGEVYLGDCLEIMPSIQDKSIDMVLTSPPYDNLRTYGGFVFDFENTARELFRVTKDGGVVVWVVGDATINGSETGTSFKQALYFKEIGFNLHDTMIYRKINYIPLTHKRYEQEFEYMFIFSRGKPKTFNPITKLNKLAGKSYNTKRPRDYDGHSIRHNTDRELVYKEFGIKGNIFDYIVGAGSERTNHPAPFPLQLAIDHIISWSNEGDTILDPFSGSGTTGVACHNLKRNYILIEKEPKYYDIILKRLSETQPYLTNE